MARDGFEPSTITLKDLFAILILQLNQRIISFWFFIMGLTKPQK